MCGWPDPSPLVLSGGTTQGDNIDLLDRRLATIRREHDWFLVALVNRVALTPVNHAADRVHFLNGLI